MKTISKYIAAALLLIVPLLASGQEKQKTTETVKYKTSIDCQDCVNKIMGNLPQEKGIKDVKCDLATKEVTVTYSKDKSNPDQIKRSLEKLGYTAKEISSPAEPKK
ncbi:MAG: heavy-metal-associated domain-containing protein [Bacteroidales bacterium]|jgi:copper chaperone CopZ|nr:heavy-metal-associated domain-containing protein [Bacteroidales bacterium]